MEGYTPPGRERDGYLSLERSQSCERTGRHAAQCHMFKDKSSQLKRPVYRCYARECHWKCQGRSCDIGSFLKAGRPRCHDLVIESKEFRRLMTGALPQFFFSFSPFRPESWRDGPWNENAIRIWGNRWRASESPLIAVHSQLASTAKVIRRPRNDDGKRRIWASR